jgi:hypothetical protein
MTMLLLFCLVFALAIGAYEIFGMVLSSPPLLAFVLLGSVGVVFAVRQYSKYQKAYFEKHPERKI